MSKPAAAELAGSPRSRPPQRRRAAQRGPSLVAVEAPAAHSFEVFESKVRIPHVRPGAVSRPGLVNQLRAQRSVRLATVVAPAGYGKTTLLAQWAARDERPVAWITADVRDNDPLVLLRHLAVAFERIGVIDASVADAVAAAPALVWLDAAPRLAAGLASSRRPFVAVLDRADVIGPGDSADLLRTLAEHVPEGSMLVLAGRDAPPVPIARLRAAGELLELGSRQLALSPHETQLLVRAEGLDLEEDDLADLVARTEGWAAGQYLATRVRGEVDGSAAAVAFGGRERFVTDYFRSEVLSSLAPERLDFLLRTSVLERMCGPLCDAVTAGRGSSAVLDELERANLFVVPLDREGDWYRYHGLFRDVLRSELEQQEPELVPTLELRAADWFEARGDLEAALGHVQAAGDVHRAARILTAVALPGYAAGRADTVEGWLERFAEYAALGEHPAVSALGGWIHAVRGRADDAKGWLEAAEGAPADAMLADGCTPVRALVALLRAALCTEGVEGMERDAGAALAALPVESAWMPAALLLRGVAHALRGEPDLAESSLAAAAEAAGPAGVADVRVIATAYRSLLAASCGDHSAAELLALEARDLLSGDSVEDYATSAIVHAAAARGCLRHGQWDAARRELVEAERLVADLTDALPWLAVATRLALAAAYVTLRDRDRASAELAEAERVLALRRPIAGLRAQAADLRRQVEELPEAGNGRGSGLTAAELRLLPLLATHLSFREIGQRLFVSRNTIKTQAISTYRKLGVSSRSGAIARASELGLVDEPGTPQAELTLTG